MKIPLGLLCFSLVCVSYFYPIKAHAAANPTVNSYIDYDQLPCQIHTTALECLEQECVWCRGGNNEGDMDSGVCVSEGGSKQLESGFRCMKFGTTDEVSAAQQKQTKADASKAQQQDKSEFGGMKKTHTGSKHSATPASLTSASDSGSPHPNTLCRIQIIDGSWPVPGVELRSVHGVRFVSDNAGLMAIDTPELYGREVWFEIHGHGYSVKPDGFGYRGIRLVPIPGQTVTVSVERDIVARRLGRLTGSGLFSESQKLGERMDWQETGVMGTDSLVTAEYNGRLHWFWGDTNLPHYPLGIFHVAGATTENFTPPTRPPLVPTYKYFTSNNNSQSEVRPRGVSDVPGEGPTWIWGAITLLDSSGSPHLVAAAQKVKWFLHVYRWDLVEWNPQDNMFRPLTTVWTESETDPVAPPVPDGHAVPWADGDGNKWILFCNPFPHLRTPATYEGWKNPATWIPLTPDKTASTPTGDAITVHGGHIAWHQWSEKWLAIFTEKKDKAEPSMLGEIWLAESTTPFGPWIRAQKVLTHDDFTFYNPVLHPEFFRDDSPIVHFEGTYTVSFSNNKQPTPRWDYNQVLYQIDLSKPPFVVQETDI
eukprot:GDKI01033817.1.p1 GENE.GDKI01033817.1~~GDKI01033817.1.p1  ORF type:complete len:593 (+),score=127.01 GDKI01033817.1:76-1854(+)